MKRMHSYTLVSLSAALACAACSTPAMSGDPSSDAVTNEVGGDVGDDVSPDGALDATVDTPPVDSGTTDANSDTPIVWPDSTVVAPPEWATLRVGPARSCPPPTACGGNVVGTWDTAGGCFEIDVESAIGACPGAMVTRRTGRGRGRVVFRADGSAHRVAEAEAEVGLTVPAICAAVVNCATIQTALASVATTATCTTDASGGCACTARTVIQIDHTDAYRIEANEIVGVVSRKRWAYCIRGDTLSYWDTSPSGPIEPGIVELRRR